MLPVLLVGLATVALALAAFVTLATWPTRVTCPECGQRTVPLADGAVPGPIARRVWRRWCSACDWQGIGRRGPDLTEGPVDHGSGFRWRSGVSPRAPWFQWKQSGDAARPSGPITPNAPESRAAGSRPPAHPSGFRWGRLPSPGAPPDHPSGFHWAGRPETETDAESGPPPAHPSGFTWADGGEAPGDGVGDADADRDGGFRWKERRET